MERALIFSDSRSVLAGIDNIEQKQENYILLMIREELFKANTNNLLISFVWIPSHMGLQGNDWVDSLAKNTSDSPLMDFYLANDLKNLLHKNIINIYENDWKNIQNNKLRLIKDSTRIWNTSNRKIRNEEIVLSRLRIGHTKITHSYIFTKEAHPTCACGFLLTVKHLFE